MKITVEIEFVKETCCVCNCIFMLPADLLVHLKRNKQSFYCYNGHSQSYTKSTAEILQEEVDRIKRENQDKQIYIQRLELEVNDLSRPKRKAKRVATEITNQPQ